MDYEDVVATFLQPATASVAVPEPTTTSSLPRRLRDAIEPIAMHSVWCRATNLALADLGLDFLRGYVWGRAAALGEPDPGTVSATFAVFAPGLVETVYAEGRAACPRDQLLATRQAATIASLGEVLADADVTPVADALQAAISSADATARPLFAGLRHQPWPQDPVGRLWRACELIREHRGDSHNAVCVAEDLGPIEMNILTELWVGMPLGSYTASRGWTETEIAETADQLRAFGLLDGDRLSDTGQGFRDRIEQRTDALEFPIAAAMGPEIQPILDQLNDWSQRCIDAGAFPPDPFKRAAG
jgi:hypothetical protein